MKITTKSFVQFILEINLLHLLPSCSKHRHIKFDRRTGQRSIVQFHDPKCTNWSGYKESFESNLRNVITTTENIAKIEAANELYKTPFLMPIKETVHSRRGGTKEVHLGGTET